MTPPTPSRPSHSKRRAVLALFVSTLSVGVAYAAAFLPGGAPPWAAWAMALGTAGTFVSITALGASRARSGVSGAVWWALAFVFALLVAGFCYPLVTGSDPRAGEPLWLGLPRRAA